MKLTERIHVVGSGWLGFGLSHDTAKYVKAKPSESVTASFGQLKPQGTAAACSAF